MGFREAEPNPGQGRVEAVDHGPHTDRMLKLQSLIDAAKCYDTVRQRRWPEGVSCRGCASQTVTKRGRADTQPERQRYHCAACGRHFDDLTGTIVAGHPQLLRTWILCV